MPSFGSCQQNVLPARLLPGHLCHSLLFVSCSSNQRCCSFARLPLLVAALTVAGYIGEFEFVDNHRSGKIVVELNGRLNKCGAISPRYDIAAKDIEAWVGRLLPSRQVSRC